MFRNVVRPAVLWAACLALSAAFAAVATPIVAQAALAGPFQVVLKDPGPSHCPAGTYVTVQPGPTQSPYFVLKSPGPEGCAPGIDLFGDPGASSSPQGIAIGLPLTAADCSQGTALLDTELLSLGASLPGPTTGFSSCPSGDVALSALQAAIGNIAVAPGSFGLDKGGRVVLPAVQNPGGYLLVDPGRSGGQPLAGLYGVTHVGQEVVILFENGNPDHPIVVGNPITPGVSVLTYPGLGTSPNLNSVVCIQIGGVWQQSTGTCEVSGGATAPKDLSIPAATTLLVDATGSLNVNGGVLTLNGDPANPGALTISGGGVLTLGPTGSVNVNGGVLTLNGNPANPGALTMFPGATLNLGSGGSLMAGGVLTLNGTTTNDGSLTIGPSGITTIQQGGSLVNGGTLTNDGSLTNDGTLVNNGSFIDLGVFVNNGVCVNC